MQQMQLYEFRLQALESRHDALMEQESRLSARTPDLERAARDTDSGVGPTGLPTTSSQPDSGIRRQNVEQLDANIRSLANVRAKTQQIEREMAGLRSRLEKLSKALADAGIEQ
jgi:prefoldin subunit 5